MLIAWLLVAAAVTAPAAAEEAVDLAGAAASELLDVGAEGQVRRTSPSWLKQVTFLSDENKRLKAEVEEFKRLAAEESAARLEEKRKLAETEAAIAASKLREAETQARILKEKRESAEAEQKRIEFERIAAFEANDMTRKTIEDRRHLAETEFQMLAAKQHIADAEERRARANLEAVRLRLTKIDTEEKVALAKETESFNTRLAKEAEASAAAAAAEAEAQRRGAEEARARAAEAEAAKVRAEAEKEAKVAAAQADSQVKMQEALAQLRSVEANATDAMARKRELDLLKAREESEARIAAARAAEQAKADAARIEQERAAALARVAAESQARVEEEMATEAVRTRAAAAAAAAERAKAESLLQLTLTGIGTGAATFLREYLWPVAGAIVLVATGYFASREATTLARQIIRAWYQKPRLIRDTSRRSGLAALAARCCCCLSCCCRGSRRVGGASGSGPGTGKSTDDDPFASMILSPPLQQTLRALAAGTRNAHRLHAPLRHALFYGPPGTGKTMAARQLAQHCGLDYAIMSGGDVAPLGAAAVTEINSVFEWARTSPRGVLIFIDEAEAFLGCRTRHNLPHDVRQTLSTVLHNTGAQSPKFMLILATNSPLDLDAAILDRMDELLAFDLPSEEERGQLGALYFNELVASRSTAAAGGKGRSCCACLLSGPEPPRIAIADGVQAAMVAASKRAQGFSGRQMYKFALRLQNLAYSSGAVGGAGSEAPLTLALVQRAFDEAVAQHTSLRAFQVHGSPTVGGGAHKGAHDKQQQLQTAAGSAGGSSAASAGGGVHTLELASSPHSGGDPSSVAASTTSSTSSGGGSGGGTGSGSQRRR